MKIDTKCYDTTTELESEMTMMKGTITKTTNELFDTISQSVISLQDRIEKSEINVMDNIKENYISLLSYAVAELTVPSIEVQKLRKSRVSYIVFYNPENLSFEREELFEFRIFKPRICNFRYYRDYKTLAVEVKHLFRRYHVDISLEDDD